MLRINKHYGVEGLLSSLNHTEPIVKPEWKAVLSTIRIVQTE